MYCFVKSPTSHSYRPESSRPPMSLHEIHSSSVMESREVFACCRILFSNFQSTEESFVCTKLSHDLIIHASSQEELQTLLPGGSSGKNKDHCHERTRDSSAQPSICPPLRSGTLSGSTRTGEALLHGLSETHFS